MNRYVVINDLSERIASSDTRYVRLVVDLQSSQVMARCDSATDTIATKVAAALNAYDGGPL